MNTPPARVGPERGRVGKNNMENTEYIKQLEHKHAAWIEEAEKTIKAFASSGQPFTSDELWRVLPPPTEPRALGAALGSASRHKVIKPTGRWILSTRESCHNRPIREWIGSQA